MSILQIDSLYRYINDQGFKDNFIYPLALAFIIGIFTLIWKFVNNVLKKLFRRKSITTIQPNSKPTSIIECVTVNTFSELCQLLLKPLEDNKYVFKTFGPNSSFSELTSLRVDMTLWHNARLENIIPNNELIRCLIEKNSHLIPV
ncbi:hypothetical protein HUW51_02580 [Adhaeribacter swui]|uniref:Uncharacterized protein n=1 Tax=Adhaeribacter swui TaxID=2086471 RepID=A0A7G7G3D0_9BACT|nr:hypothetical protein [Adhaeribacter swui]QNF31664.1 hypothetical protein HUW51_02580 [Adhaeribacter swui]